MGVAVGATDVTPAISTGTAPFPQRRLSAPELWWLRWNILASRWPGLRDAVALAARACAACALVLAAARAGAVFAEDEDSNPASAGIRRRRGWKHAAVSAEVYRGAAALVVPFVLLPALAFARESLVRIAREAKRWRTPRFDVSVVFLADARDDATRRAARARDDAFFFKRDGRGGGIRTDAERYTRARGDTYSAAKAHPTTPTTVAMMIGVLLEVLIDVARIASPARVPPSRRRARNASSRDFSNATSREFGVADGADAEPEIERALATMARATRRAGGEDAARWLELLRQENALPPTTALVLVRDAAARETSRAKKPKKPSGNAFRRGVSRGDVADDGPWSRGPADDSDGSSSIDEGPFDERPSSVSASDSSDASDASSSDSRSSSSSLPPDDPAARLAIALVVHVVPGVPRLAVGPPASARVAGGGWRGDARRFHETCPEFISVAVVEVPRRGGAPGAFVADADAASSADVADAVASVAASLARRLGVHAVVVPVAEDAPTPFLAAALAKLGAHAVLRRPADDPGFVLRLTEGGAWDGAACGAHARARRDHRRRARRFAEIGGIVAEADAGGSAFASEVRLREWTRDFAWPIAASSRPSIERHDDTGRVASFRTPRVEMFDAASPTTGDDDAAVRASPNKNAPDPDAAAAFAVDGASLASSSFLFARNDANARVAAFRAAMSPADRSAGWRVLEARVGGERVGALLLETRPSGDGAVARRLRNRRNRRDASELAAGSRDRVWVRACWLHPDAARARRADAYRALLRGAVAFAAARGCVRLDLGAGGAREKRRMGAMPARATAMVLFDDWTLGAPADADAEVGLSEDLLRWASNGSGGRRGTGTDAAAAAAAAATASRPPPSAASPGPSRRAARRAARLEKRRALKLTRVASRAFRAVLGAAERAKTAAGGVTGAGTIPETIDDSPRDDAGLLAGEYYEEYYEEYYSDGDSNDDDDDDDVLFVDADDEDAA